MLFIIEGSQGVGKTTLIKNSPLKDYYYHFSFSEHVQELNLKGSANDLWNFTMGKDLQLLEWAHNHPNQTMVVDRGFLSTIVYAQLLNRASEEQINGFLQYLITSRLLTYVEIIYISGKNNSFKREHNDGFDELYSQQEAQDRIYNQIITANNICPIHQFRNDFDERSIKDFSELVSILL